MVKRQSYPSEHQKSTGFRFPLASDSLSVDLCTDDISAPCWLKSAFWTEILHHSAVMLPYSRFDKLRLTERLPMRSLPRLILFGALVFVVFMLYSNYNDKKPLKEENELNVFKWAPPPVRHDTARNLTSYKSSPLFDAYYNCVYPKLRPLKGKYVEVSSFQEN